MLYPLSYGGSDADALTDERQTPTVVRAAHLILIHGPSPPDAVHERGSQGSSASSALVGGSNPFGRGRRGGGAGRRRRRSWWWWPSTTSDGFEGCGRVVVAALGDSPRSWFL